MIVNNTAMVYEGIGFTAQAVAQYPVDEWIEHNYNKYFPKMPKEEKDKVLSEIHKLCVDTCVKNNIEYEQRSYNKPPKKEVPKKRAARKRNDG